jgi:hypothetical protein
MGIQMRARIRLAISNYGQSPSATSRVGIEPILHSVDHLLRFAEIVELRRLKTQLTWDELAAQAQHSLFLPLRFRVDTSFLEEGYAFSNSILVLDLAATGERAVRAARGLQHLWETRSLECAERTPQRGTAVKTADIERLVRRLPAAGQRTYFMSDYRQARRAAAAAADILLHATKCQVRVEHS